MASKRSGIFLVLVALASFVSALEFTQMSNEGNDVLGWTGGAQVDQPAVLPGPITEPWVPSEDIADTLERMCSITCQAGNDQDRKGFCTVYSTLVRLTSTSKLLDRQQDAKQENVEKKMLECLQEGQERE